MKAKTMTTDDITLQLVQVMTRLDTTMTNIQKQITEHETRIQRLETDRPTLKANIIELLIKGLVVAVISIASLSGAAGIVSKIFCT